MRFSSSRVRHAQVPAVAFYGVWWLPFYMPDPDIELAVGAWRRAQDPSECT